MNDSTNVQIPGKAVSDNTDLRQPVRALLEDLNLLGTAQEDQDAQGFQAAFTGPPQSVAVIEAGATAAAKWWAAGLGAAVIATWSSVAVWWVNRKPASRSLRSAGSPSSPWPLSLRSDT